MIHAYPSTKNRRVIFPDGLTEDGDYRVGFFKNNKNELIVAVVIEIDKDKR